MVMANRVRTQSSRFVRNIFIDETGHLAIDRLPSPFYLEYRNVPPQKGKGRIHESQIAFPAGSLHRLDHIQNEMQFKGSVQYV